MSESGARCPISGELIDESTARINGTITLIVLAFAVFTSAHWLLAYLALDFGVKIFSGFAYSPNCVIARFVASALRLPRRMTDSAPKRFAAAIGMIMSAAGLVAGWADLTVVFNSVVGVFAFCAALESLAGVCVGCHLYGLLPQGVSRFFVRGVVSEVTDG